MPLEATPPAASSVAKGRCLVAHAAGALTAGLASVALAGPALFDKPTQVARVPLSHDPQNPQAKARVSCFYYPRFMVKEIDLGEQGAEQLSIVPLSATTKPGCRRENAADETVIAAGDWTGYFKGVKGDFVFCDADDGRNDGVGFAIFAAGGKKLFDDIAKSLHAIDVIPAGIAVRYIRVLGASCSLRADAGCWQQIKRDNGLAGGVAARLHRPHARAEANAGHRAAGHRRSHRHRLRGRGGDRGRRAKDCPRLGQGPRLQAGAVRGAVRQPGSIAFARCRDASRSSRRAYRRRSMTARSALQANNDRD
jgi:hypothetical protein